MGMKQDMDELMDQIQVTGEMHRAIMEGKKMKNHKKFSFRKVAIPAAAALLVGSTMYVGAGYVMERIPLREIFVERQFNVVAVPEAQKMSEIYEDVVDYTHSAVNDLPDEPLQDSESDSSMAEDRTGVPMGKYGELIIDNEYFSIELLESICTGRELSLSYILTYKKHDLRGVHLRVETDDYREILDGPTDLPADNSHTLLDSGFGSTLMWNQLPADCIYELEMNQELCTYTQLAKEDYSSGIYHLYALYSVGMGSNNGRKYFEAPIEVISNDNYGIALNGATDKTEGDVHFDTYAVYISPWNVYLTLEGTYKGEMDSIWGAKSSHVIAIRFKDGTEAHTTVGLTGMGYGSGQLDVDMRAAFDAPIDPEAIASVMLDDVVIMGE